MSDCPEILGISASNEWFRGEFMSNSGGTDTLKTVEIFTDGACSGNPGPGGWTALLIYGDYEREISGSEPYTTNQRMELTAAVEALKLLKYPCRVKLYSDSAYLINAFTQGWVEKWELNGWLNARKAPVENRDLWEALLDLSRVHKIEWNKVKGHAGNEGNVRCDRLATAEVRRLIESSVPNADCDNRG